MAACAANNYFERTSFFLILLCEIRKKDVRSKLSFAAVGGGILMGKPPFAEAEIFWYFCRKKSHLARFIHIALAVLVLASSSGIVLTKHYCQGKFRSQALFVAPESCHTTRSGQVGQPVCPFHADQSKGPTDEKKGCCDNRSAVVKSDIPLWHKLPDLSHLLTAPVPAFVCPALPEYLSFLHLRIIIRLPQWATGLPPPKYGLQVLLQVFRN